MDINQIVNGVGAGIVGALTLWFLQATKRDKKRKQKNGTNK